MPGSNTLTWSQLGLDNIPGGTNGQVLTTTAGNVGWASPSTIDSSFGLYTLAANFNINVGAATTLPLTVTASTQNSVTAIGDGTFRLNVAKNYRVNFQSLIFNGSATDYANVWIEKNGVSIYSTRCPSVASGLQLTFARYDFPTDRYRHGKRVGTLQ